MERERALDPLGLAADPIWRPELDALNALLLTLASDREPAVKTIDLIKAESEDHTVTGLVDSMTDLSRALSRSKGL